jgi:hypothetical protein
MRLKLDTSKSSTVFCRRFFAGGAGPNVGWKDGLPKVGFFSHGLGLGGVGPGVVSWTSVIRRKHKPQVALSLCYYATLSVRSSDSPLYIYIDRFCDIGLASWASSTIIVISLITRVGIEVIDGSFPLEQQAHINPLAPARKCLPSIAFERCLVRWHGLAASIYH